jgi:hypothetical protein
MGQIEHGAKGKFAGRLMVVKFTSNALRPIYIAVLGSASSISAAREVYGITYSGYESPSNGM